ncbi:MAG: XrtA system polysaccharide chain length determinant [Burkholderiaceae bacterium]
MSDSGLSAMLEQAKAVMRRLWRRRWLGAAVTAVVGLLSSLVVSMAPERYEASARIYVDTQTVLKPLMVGLAYQPDIDQQVRMLARTVVSRPNMERLIDRRDIEWPAGDKDDREKLLTRLMEKIKVESAGSGNLYTVTYRDVSPVRARRLVEGTVDLFVHSSSTEKQRDSADAGKFIEDQIKSQEVKLVAAESRLKDFKIRNFGVSGVASQDHFARMSALADQVNKLRIDLQAAEQSRDSYRRELSGEEPLLPPDVAAPAVPTEVDVRLDAQRRQLDDLLRRYTEAHPDVTSARRIVAQLELQKRQEAEQRLRPDANGKVRGTAATSPVYQRIRVSLAETEAQVASLRAQLRAQQEQLDKIRATAGRVPQVESELAQLNRDYDVIRKNYDLLVARRESASLGLKLDESSQLADFRVVEPPRVSPNPVFPGRAVLGLMAVVGSLVAGVLAALGVEQLRPTFEDAKSLREVSGRPVLGAIAMWTPEGIAGTATRVEAARFVGAIALLLALQIAWLAWVASRPLT